MTDHYNSSQTLLIIIFNNNNNTTQPFNDPLSGTSWVSRYQKKQSLTHTHEEEEGFAQITRFSLSQRGLLWLTMDQYAGSPGHSTYCYAELAASFINFLNYCSPSSGFYSAGKDNRSRLTDNLSGRHPIRTIDASTSSRHFYAERPFCRNPPNSYWPGTGAE